MPRLFANLKVRFKIGLGFALVLLLLVTVGGDGILGLRAASDGFDQYARISRNTVRTAANQVLTSAKALSTSGEALRTQMDNFLLEVRAA